MSAHGFHRRAVPLVVLALSLMLMVLTVPSSQAAEGLVRAQDQLSLAYTHRSAEHRIGPLVVDAQGRRGYCMETDLPAELWYGDVEAIGDSEDSRAIAYLAERYRSSDDALIQAAVAVLVHDYFDLRMPDWLSRRSSLSAQRPDIIQKAEELWAQARTAIPVDARSSVGFTEAKRRGFVDVHIINPQGTAVADVPYEARLIGPAVFAANGKSDIAGVSQADGSRLDWVATGDGPVRVTLDYEYQGVERLVSAQDYLRSSGAHRAAIKEQEIEVRKSFSPVLTSRVPQQVLDGGEGVEDTVNSDVVEGDVWAAGVSLKAQGYFFEGLTVADLSEEVFAGGGDTSAAVLEALAEKGLRHAASSEIEFTDAGQSFTVAAYLDDARTQRYALPTTGGFGSWIWVIARDEQDDESRGYLEGDYATAFPDALETVSGRSQVLVDSSVTEHTASRGSVLSDTITVTGFPADHGEFKGNPDFGFAPDNAVARVRLLWSGDAKDARKDILYEPATQTPPEEDEHHKVVGTWEYPARNGVFKIGGGAPDVHGMPVNIVADVHGYYVFIYEFHGDDRASPVASSYMDAWERVRVLEDSPPPAATLTTKASPGKANVGDECIDTAEIRGRVEDGSYVTFTAYGATSEHTMPDLLRPLLQEERVALEADSAEQDASSPGVRAEQAGAVFWKATLWGPDGNIIDAHHLGAAGEVTTVASLPQSAAAERQPGTERLADTGSGVVARFALLSLTLVGFAVALHLVASSH